MIYTRLKTNFGGLSTWVTHSWDNFTITKVILLSLKEPVARFDHRRSESDVSNSRKSGITLDIYFS